MKLFNEKILKGSIKYKLVTVSTALIAFTIFLLWFVNRNFLIRYYEHSKTELLGTTYSEINDIYNRKNKDNNSNSDINLTEDNIFYYNFNSGNVNIKSPNLNDEIALTFERLSSNKNMSLYIFDIFYNRQNLFLEVSYPPARSLTFTQKDILSERVTEYYTNDSSEEKAKKLLKASNKYNVYQVFDNRMNSNYIELFGNLDNGSTIYIRTNLESMQESVAISNKFLALVGFVTTLIGILIMFFISKSYTKPILELSDIAKRMSDLDFDVKYETTTEDEIGTLGTSINRLSEKLETTISELKSANNELQTDIQKKIEIDELRKDFLSNVSHELKTPIALIQGYAEGLKENVNEDAENRDFYCEVIMDEARKMNEMVKKLLTLNQIEFGTNQINIERFDIVTLIKSIISSTEILFQQKNVTLKFEETGRIYVWADEYMIEEVVTNYINNALNHVTNANVIEIKLESKEEVIRVSIFNTGNQIPEDELENIWVKFYKIDKARTREYGGSGIGLSIVKAIISSMNSECGVINHADGVEFWFEIDKKI